MSSILVSPLRKAELLSRGNLHDRLLAARELLSSGLSPAKAAREATGMSVVKTLMGESADHSLA